METPEHLRPSQPVESTEVPVPEMAVATLKRQEIVKVGHELGLITVGDDLMQSLAEVGGNLEKGGIVRAANGLSYVSAGALSQLMLKITHDALQADDKTRLKITETLVRVSNAIDKQARALKIGTERQAQPSGAPGRHGTWQPHQHVHFHQHNHGGANAVDKELKPA